MGECCLEINITDTSNTRMEETARTQSRVEASNEGGQSTVGVGGPWMDG